jgi:hypothetical protein
MAVGTTSRPFGNWWIGISWVPILNDHGYKRSHLFWFFVWKLEIL